MDGTVLVADDDRTIRTVLTQALTRAGAKVHATSSLATLMRWIEEGRGDVVITDVMMPDGNGLEMVPWIVQRRPDLPVIVISAQNTILTAIKAAEAEAFDYLPKPFDLPDLMKRTARALDGRHRAAPRAADMQGRAAQDDLPLIGQTPLMQAVFVNVAQVMNTDLTVLICGESGTGKSLIARAMHDLSERRDHPFLSLSPGDLQGADGAVQLMERARGGTILIEAVRDLDPAAQGRVVRLLDAVEAGESGARPRVLVTTRGAANEIGPLREDLYFRLGGAVIEMPALRDRLDDIALLVQHVLARLSDTAPPCQIAPEAVALLRRYHWPGNVRQLENLLRRLALAARDNRIEPAAVKALLAGQPAPDPAAQPGDGETLTAAVARHMQRYFDLHGAMLPPAGLYQRILPEIEAPLIAIALEATGGNQVKCADLLGINRNTLRKKITDLDIRVTRHRKLM